MTLLNLLKTLSLSFIALLSSALHNQLQAITPAEPIATQSNSAKIGAFVFAYFNTGDEGESQGLQYAYSYDGLTWEKLNAPQQTFLSPNVGGKLLRDPSIVKGPDGMFHMVWTTDWWKHGIGISHSKDLIHWTPQEYLDVMADYEGTVNCWAPEISYDPATSKYLIYWASTIPGKFPDSEGKSETFTASEVNGVKAAHRMYVTTTSDFKTYSPTKLLFDDGYNCIDAFIVRDDLNSRYVMAIKNEDLNPIPKKDIRLSFSENALGPWSKSSEPISPEWVEGPAILKVGEWWYLYYDAYTRHRYEGLKTKDFKTWVSITDELKVPKGMRHGTAISVERSVLDNLLEYCNGKK